MTGIKRRLFVAEIVDSTECRNLDLSECRMLSKASKASSVKEIHDSLSWMSVSKHRIQAFGLVKLGKTSTKLTGFENE